MNLNDGKEREFEDIINRFSGFIKALIQKYNLQKYGIDGDDISQEVKIKIWKVFQDEKKIKYFASYIKKIVNSSIIDQLRKLKREKRIFIHERQENIQELKNASIAEFFDENTLSEIVGEGVNSLISSRRRVVKLFLLDMTIEEIAIYLGYTRDKTRNLLYRGLLDLKQILKKKGIEYENR